MEVVANVEASTLQKKNGGGGIGNNDKSGDGVKVEVLKMKG